MSPRFLRMVVDLTREVITCEGIKTILTQIIERPYYFNLLYSFYLLDGTTFQSVMKNGHLEKSGGHLIKSIFLLNSGK